MLSASINERLNGIAASAAARNDVEFVRAEIAGTKRNATLRIFIDKPNGVTLEDCTAVSHAIEEVLDSEDLIPQAYTLEVSSPGLERDLVSLNDFERFTGHKAKIKLAAEIDGRKSLIGRIAAVEGDEIVFEDKAVGTKRFSFGAVVKANLRVDLEDEFKKRR
jgi:ribosome maturation factor RimP